MESYTGIILGIKETKDTTQLDPYVQDIFQYFNLLCPPDGQPAIELAKLMAGLIGDLTEIYGVKLGPVLQAPFIERILCILEKSNGKEHKQLARWVRITISKVNKPEPAKNS